ncbi:MAG TPA: hypothetical protein GXX34_06310 [Clostridia bacterium]|nr:hypothetical protein [Clostridia bacterium]
MIICQLSLFSVPHRTVRQEIIDEIVERLKYFEVEYEKNKFSITVYGREDDVWTAVQDLFHSLRQTCSSSILQAVFLEGDVHQRQRPVLGKVACK